MGQFITNKYHLAFIKKLKEFKTDKNKIEYIKNYLGSNKILYGIDVSTITLTVKDWVKKHQDLQFNDYLDLLNSLYFSGKSFEEILIAGKLLFYLPKFRSNLDPIFVNKWLDRLEGWAEVDSLCQSNFSYKELSSNWKSWKTLISDLVRSEIVCKKRASLVLLIKSIRESNDTRFVNLAFRNIQKLCKEKSRLITKAISWLLREMVKNNKEKVKDFMKSNQHILPRIALRETKKKILFNKKS